MERSFVRPLSASARVVVESSGRPVEGYAVMLQVVTDDGWMTIRLYDNAHGQHDVHDYTGFEKQPAQHFMDGAVRDVIPAAIREIVDHWEAMVRSWKS